MPHIVIEHSNEMEITELMQDLHHLICAFGEFNPSAVKSRSIAFNDYVLPENSDDFVHVTISILAGRAIELRQKLADSVFGLMRNSVSAQVKLSLDIREMVADTYRKN